MPHSRDCCDRQLLSSLRLWSLMVLFLCEFIRLTAATPAARRLHHGVPMLPPAAVAQRLPEAYVCA